MGAVERIHREQAREYEKVLKVSGHRAPINYEGHDRRTAGAEHGS